MSVLITYKSSQSNNGGLALLCEEVGAVQSVCVCVCVEGLLMSVTHSQFIQHLFRKNIQWGMKV